MRLECYWLSIGGIDPVFVFVFVFCCENWSCLQYTICCMGADIMESQCLPRLSFACAICGAKQAMLWCGLKPASGFVGSGASWEWLPCTSRSAQPVTGPGRSYKVICSCLLPVLDLELCGRGHTVNPDHLLPVMGLRKEQKAQSSLRPATDCQLPIRLSQ